jgi:hypothetical protein
MIGSFPSSPIHIQDESFNHFYQLNPSGSILYSTLISDSLDLSSHSDPKRERISSLFFLDKICRRTTTMCTIIQLTIRSSLEKPTAHQPALPFTKQLISNSTSSSSLVVENLSKLPSLAAKQPTVTPQSPPPGVATVVVVAVGVLPLVQFDEKRTSIFEDDTRGRCTCLDFWFGAVRATKDE